MLDGYSWLSVPQPTLKPFSLLSKGKKTRLGILRSKPITVVHSDIRDLLPSSSGGVPPSINGGNVLLTDATFKYDFDASVSLGIPLVSVVGDASVDGHAGARWTYIYRFKKLVSESVTDRISFRREIGESFIQEFGKDNFDTIKDGQAFVLTDLVSCYEFEVRKIRTDEAGFAVRAPSMSQCELSAEVESSSDLVLRYSESNTTAVAFKVCRLVYDTTEGVVRIGEESIQTYRGSSSQPSNTLSDFLGDVVQLE